MALPDLATDRISRQLWGRSWRFKQHWNGQAECPPLGVIASVKNALRLSALNLAARKAGLYKHQTLADARAILPALECHQADAAADAALLDALADWCERYTPLLAVDTIHGLSGLMLDITGCAHLFNGEEALRLDMISRLTAQGFAANIAIASTPGAAWGMARYGDPATCRLIAPGAERERLAPLPLEALRTEPSTVEELKRVGLKTIGCIMDLPRGPLSLRFGRTLLRRLDQALAREEETISPRIAVAELAAERQFVEPVSLQDDISRTILSLAGNLKPALEKRAIGARVLVLKLFRVDGERRMLSVVTANPEREPAHIGQLFQDRLASLHSPLDAGFGYDLIRLEVAAAEPMVQQQADFVARVPVEDGYNALINRLGARLGTDRVQHFAVNDSHIPERSFGTVSSIHKPIIRPNSKTGRMPPQDALSFAEPSQMQALDMQLTRPVLLLNRPEPVEVMAEIPEGLPQRFRWRRVLYEVAASEGPERIACEWWRDGRQALTRDYFKTEDRDGRRFWLFRQGLYQRESGRPHWYMHGLFP
uniref:Y-family DNA polymerase n=1 Tax=Pararhizobium sp. IMCC3301 TaxID=3067904 RepID=UPI0035321709